MGKKYKVSGLYSVLSIGCTVFFLLSVLFEAYPFAPSSFWDLEVILFSAGILIGLYVVIFDALCGRFIIDEKGITMLTTFKSWYLPWASIKECDTTWTRTANDGGTYFVYLSTRHLTNEEKRKFLSKTRFDLKNIAYFQYSTKLMKNLYPLLPPEIAEQLQQKGAIVESSMNNFERRHHK